METPQKDECLKAHLKEAGCRAKSIDELMGCLARGETEALIRLLARHRRVLVEKMHEAQRRVDCLDYLVERIKNGEAI